MNDTKVHNIDEYITKSNNLLSSGFFTYRGQYCSSWSLEPGIIRKIKNTYNGIGESGLLFRLSVDHLIEILKKARSNKYFSDDICDLNILAILQHYGAATPLLDFSNDPLVALYFACQPCKDKDAESDGNVFCINYSSQIRSNSSPLRPVNDPSLINIESALNDTSRYIWYWSPPNDLCKRSKKQQSVFVFGWGLYWKYDTKKLIDELKILIISAESKKGILKDLKEKYDISEQTLFPDIYGFAQSNRYDKIIQHYSAEEFYDKGEEQWGDGSPEWAAEYYKMAYTTKKLEWIDARCKCALALSWNGEQNKALNVIDESIKKFGEFWKYYACRAIIIWKIEQDWKDDLRRAEELANNANESSEFKTFVNDYSVLPYD
ncbi:MAG: FRG domain-containing protein [Desulfovibrionales bacterium]|nr:FRG domain-containing protein [Desulfovibrionales bacterium]